jgi:hypothetical protein
VGFVALYYLPGTLEAEQALLVVVPLAVVLLVVAVPVVVPLVLVQGHMQG